MTGFEWFLLIVVVILIPLLIAVVVTLWTLEQARKRNRRNRPGGKQPGVARRAARANSGASVEDQSADTGKAQGGDGRRDESEIISADPSHDKVSRGADASNV